MDKKWRTLWEKRFSNPLEDAETLKMQGENIIELGKKPRSYKDIEAQYIGLFKIILGVFAEVLAFYDGLGRALNYDGKDFNNMYIMVFCKLLLILLIMLRL